ncbi:MAG: DUF4132 domain-containing protein [Pseudomonadales bacterium]|nr:DUF4132 domain-containing protein [Pseudomonadales bacterium]
MLKNIFSSNKKQSLLCKMFDDLNRVEDKLTEKTVAYLIDGEDPAIVTRISTLTDAQIQEAGLVFNQHYYGVKNDIKQRNLKNYDLLITFLSENEVKDADIMRRLGFVFDALVKSKYYEHYEFNDIPTWVKGFVHVIGLYHQGGHNSKVTWPENYTGRWFYDTLKNNDVSDLVFLAIMLERSNSYCTNIKLFDYLINKFNWDDLLNNDIFPDMLNKLHFSAKITLSSILNDICDLNNNLKLLTLLVTDKSKQVRKQAGPLLSMVGIGKFLEFSTTEFFNFTVNQRKELASLLLIHGNDSTVTELEKLAKQEKSKSVKESIESALLNKSAAASNTNELIIPNIPELIKESSLEDSFQSNIESLLIDSIKKAKISADNEIISNKENNYKYTWAQKNLKDLKGISKKNIIDYTKFVQGEQLKTSEYLTDIVVRSNIFSIENLSIYHIIRILQRSYYYGGVCLRNRVFTKWLNSNPNIITDIRQLIPILEKFDVNKRQIASWYFSDDWSLNAELPDIGNVYFWPFFAENKEFLDEAFALIPSTGKYQTFDPSWAMSILSHFPVIPEKYIQVLYVYALSSSKTYGPYARQILEGYGLVESRVIQALKSSKQDERGIAAQWLVKLGHKEAITELTSALKKEKREATKAILLSALHDLGEPIDQYLSAKVLLLEAKNGLKKALPKAIEWFNFDSLPTIKWINGKKVDPIILKWWIVLATKLKEPEGNPLINLYIQQLDELSQKTLGNYILQIFIGQDTQCPSDEIASDYAENAKQSTFDNYQNWAKSEWGQQYKNKTIQDAYNDLFNHKKSEYLGSAISSKGFLCLASNMQAVDGVQLITRYMKDHYTRRHQIEAILIAIAQNDNPIVIQLLLSIARRHRTNSVQMKAKELVLQIANRNNWTQDELADRTIPTAGFELNGMQELEMGARKITIRLTDDLKPQIINEDGKILKALPTARQNDDADKVKDSKKQFSTIKKELKQVSELQLSRLYESMCVERVWPFSEWEEFLLNHPVMTHFTQKLIWLINQDGKDIAFRPTAEREIIDAQDDEVEIQDDATVRLAHIGSMNTASMKQWNQLLKEEKIKQPFKQFILPKHHLCDADLKKTELDYHQGWITDTFSIRGVLTKLGYKRGDAEDGGFFSHYYKDYSSLNIRTIIEFSGNCLPEELLPAVLFKLAFVNPTKGGWFSEESYKKIEDVPNNLVLEAMKDYEMVASKGSYDEKWQSKNPW